jgi:hypothetical protein
MKNPKHISVSKQQAQKRTSKIIARLRGMERDWACLGKEISDCLRDNVPAALGMTAQAWMEATVPGSTTKAWRALRIHRALASLPQKKVLQLTEGNANALARLPEKQRKSKTWLKKAIDTPTEKFREEVATELAEKHGIKREEFISLRVSLPRSIFEKWEASFKKIAMIANIDIEQDDRKRIAVWEYLAAFIDGIPEETIKNVTEGVDV